MKRHALMVSFFLAAGSISAAFAETTWTLSFPAESVTKQEGVAVVKQYMDLLIGERNEGASTEAERFKLLSEEWLESKSVDPGEYKLNDYAFAEYSILGVENNYVVVNGSNPNGWARVVKFRLLVENGRLVIEPSQTSTARGLAGIVDETNSVTPWWTTSGLLKTEIDASYKEADKTIMERDAALLETVLDPQYGGDERICGEVVACGPFIWKALAKEEAFADATGAKLHVLTPSGSRMQGRGFRSQDAILALESYLRRLFKEDGGFTVRKLTPEELKLYSGMIPYPIEEPIFILASKTRRILADVVEGKVFFLEDFDAAASSVMY